MREILAAYTAERRRLEVRGARDRARFFEILEIFTLDSVRAIGDVREIAIGVSRHGGTEPARSGRLRAKLRGQRRDG